MPRAAKPTPEPEFAARVFAWMPDDERALERVEEFGTFTDVLRGGESKTTRQVAMVSWSGEHLDAFAVLSQTGRVAAFKVGVRLSNFQEDFAPVKWTELASWLTDVQRKNLADGMPRGQLNKRTTRALRDALEEHAPQAAAAWRAAQADASRDQNDLWPDDRVPVVAYERDAVGLALSLGGIPPRTTLSEWRGNSEAPFLAGIPEFRVYEDAAVNNDAGWFAGWEGLRGATVGVAQFTDRNRRVTVLNANRMPTERALGCDLIYYSHEYDSYVLVQYKRFTRANDGWEFRPSADANLDDELKRMRAISTTGAPRNAPLQYRLSDRFCFLKFCRPTTKNAFLEGLAKGIYLPLDYLDELRASNSLKGPRGGEVLTHDRADRWITNSAFINLVRDAWVGSQGTASHQIETFIRESLAAGHSLILADGDNLAPAIDRQVQAEEHDE